MELSEREMCGWELSGGKCPGTELFGWEISGGNCPGEGGAVLVTEFSGGNCPGDIVRGGIYFPLPNHTIFKTH